ncbi:MAG: methyltransferase [Gemmatimonadota bacterium]|nr:MAG: methyltransferase [Gemmatimonadota bacterium]
MIGTLAPVTIRQRAGTYALTPASGVSLTAIAEHQALLRGSGIDWGCGTGCLAIVAAKISAVEAVVGLDSSELDVRVAAENAAVNGVDGKTTFLHADSYHPNTRQGREALVMLRGKVDFVLANPPASRGDDGFSFRREVLTGAREFLKGEAVVLVQISIQYSQKRIDLLTQIPGFRYAGCLATTPWVPFDQDRSDLRQHLVDYAAEEWRGGLDYTFGDPRNCGRTFIDARTALDLFRQTGMSPLSQWQVHLFRYERGSSG